MGTEKYVELLEDLVAAAAAPALLPGADRPADEVTPPLVRKPWKKLARRSARRATTRPTRSSTRSGSGPSGPATPPRRSSRCSARRRRTSPTPWPNPERPRRPPGRGRRRGLAARGRRRRKARRRPGRRHADRRRAGRRGHHPRQLAHGLDGRRPKEAAGLARLTAAPTTRAWSNSGVDSDRRSPTTASPWPTSGPCSPGCGPLSPLTSPASGWSGSPPRWASRAAANSSVASWSCSARPPPERLPPLPGHRPRHPRRRSYPGPRRPPHPCRRPGRHLPGRPRPAGHRPAQLALGPARGNDTVKLDPRPSSLSTRTVPPWASATWRTMARPSPVPPVWRARPCRPDRSARTPATLAGRDTLAGVGHLDHGPALGGLEADTHGPLGRGVAQGVVEQVGHQQPELAPVAAQGQLRAAARCGA